jgi:transposase
VKTPVHKHKKYQPVPTVLRRLIIKKVNCDGLSYSKVSEELGVSKGLIVKVIGEGVTSRSHAPQKRGKAVEGKTELAYKILAELAKMSQLKPVLLSKLWLAAPPLMVPLMSQRPESYAAQVRRVLKSEGLDKLSINKYQPGVVAVHMVKIEWENSDCPDEWIKGLLFISMDLGTGRMNQKVYKRVTLWRVLDLIDTLMDKLEHECRKIAFTTRAETQKSGNIRQVACIYKLSSEVFISTLKVRLLEKYRNIIEISADPPIKRSRQRLKMDEKFKDDDDCEDINNFFTQSVSMYNEHLLSESS